MALWAGVSAWPDIWDVSGSPQRDARLIAQRRVFLMTALLLFRPSFHSNNSCSAPAFLWPQPHGGLHFNGTRRIYFGPHLNVLSAGKEKGGEERFLSERHSWSKSNISGAGFPWQWRATPFMAFRGQPSTMCHPLLSLLVCFSISVWAEYMSEVHPDHVFTLLRLLGQAPVRLSRGCVATLACTAERAAVGEESGHLLLWLPRLRVQPESP